MLLVGFRNLIICNYIIWFLKFLYNEIDLCIIFFVYDMVNYLKYRMWMIEDIWMSGDGYIMLIEFVFFVLFGLRILKYLFCGIVKENFCIVYLGGLLFLVGYIFCRLL